MSANIKVALLYTVIVVGGIAVATLVVISHLHHRMGHLAQHELGPIIKTK